MRRLALVASAGGDPARERELDEVLRWLRALPSQGLRTFERLTDVPLDQTDVLWTRGEPESDPRLLAWLEAGGRLLATHEGTGVAVALGLAHDRPVPIPVSDPPPPGFGLAGFGSHPLFSGLRDGAVLVPAFDGGAPVLRGYAGRRPEGAAVVAVARRALELDPETVLAWEYGVGAGGVLCLGFHPSLPVAGGSSLRREAELVLANALVGDAVPHRERASPAVAWPSRGTRAVETAPRDPPLVAPADPWPPSAAAALELAPAAEWTHAGRRLLVRSPAEVGVARSGYRRSASCTTRGCATPSPARRDMWPRTRWPAASPSATAGCKNDGSRRPTCRPWCGRSAARPASR